jgi:hypothetical protein
MNLFRSEEHVKRWSLYSQATEDYILPVDVWADIFSGPLFTQRLAPDYLENGEEYVAAYHDALREAGKSSPYWQYPLIAAMEEVRLSRFQVVGAYTRFEPEVLNDLKDARNRIVAGLETATGKRENHLVWAAPGSGKTFFVEQIAAALQGEIRYLELNLARLEEDAFRGMLATVPQSESPVLCLIDEVDARPDEVWPYEVLMPHLDTNLGDDAHVVFVLAGSSGFSLEGMKQRLSSRPKGNDALSRIPAANQFVIPPMSFGDRVLIVLSQFLDAGRRLGHEINYVEKLGLYYIAVNTHLANARQLQEFAARAVERIPRGDDRIKYDHLFTPGDPENKRFWMEVAGVARELVNQYLTIEP